MFAAHSVITASHPVLFQGERSADLERSRRPSCIDTYWPAETLNVFMLRMAAAGHCVNAAMMLGDRHYALQQLTLALALKDQALQEMASELSDYFRF